jgi:DTW domain-containing protein
MFMDLCVCDVIPVIQTSIRVVIVMHHVEAMRQTNTGKLVLSSLPDTQIRLRGLMDKHSVCDDMHNDPLRRVLLLYPGPTSRELNEELIAEDDRPITLVVPDGTWNQTRKIPLREVGLRQVQQVRIPFEKRSNYRLREAGLPDRLATFEAISRAMEIFEGSGARKSMDYLFQVAVERMLWSKGRYAEEKVLGGLSFRDEIKSRRLLNGPFAV